MKKILLIEDNLEILENTSEILELAGYTVYTAENGKIGVEAAIENHPDLIISDIMMPVLDGFGVLHLVQKNPELSGIPFIFLTARTERSDFRKGMEAGADDYITKPFSDTELLNAVESRLKKIEQLKTNMASMEGAGSSTNFVSAEQSLKQLFADRIINRYKRKQIIFTEGNFPQYLFYVVKGKVKAFKSSDEGKELTVGLYANGDFMGYTALLEEAGYKVTTEALEDCEIALIPREDFFSLINGNRAISNQFLKLLARNNNQKAEQMVHLAYNSLRKRVANALLLLQNKYRTQKEDTFLIHITRLELANLSGTTTESLIRTLSDFRHEKLIQIKENGIALIDEKRLEYMIN